MKLDTDSFPVGMVELMDKKVLVRSDQAETTKGTNVAVSDELHNMMIKPHNPESACGRRTCYGSRLRG
jgi:hypothetical protein